MKKYDLFQSGENIIRVLEVQGDRVLVIDCIKRTMPLWVELVALESYSECTNDDLSEVTGIVVVGVDDLDADQRKTIYERYTMIAPILPFVLPFIKIDDFYNLVAIRLRERTRRNGMLCTVVFHFSKSTSQQPM